MGTFNKELGQRVRNARIESGLSQQDLANRIGTTQDAVSLYERGARAVSLETLVAIAKALNKPLGYFLELKPELVVVKNSRLYEVVSDIQEHRGELDLLCEIWDFLKTRRSRRC